MLLNRSSRLTLQKMFLHAARESKITFWNVSPSSNIPCNTEHPTDCTFGKCVECMTSCIMQSGCVLYQEKSWSKVEYGYSLP